MREREKGRTQEQAAAKANVHSRQTAAKYEQLGKLPSALKQPRDYRTREDPFIEDWPQMEQMLQTAPELEAKALFEWLCEQRPDRYQAGQLRTFQRRVSNWRAFNQFQIATLDQVRQPGEMMQTDGTWLTELGVTIQGEVLKHVLIHSVLPYSNWEWGRIAPTESLAALQLGLQSSLQKLGYVPQYHQTDNSGAATHQLGMAERGQAKTERGYTSAYLQLLQHFGLKPRVTHIQSPDENGDVEALHGAFKRSLKQHLLLRGSRAFDSIEGYESFIFSIMEKRNALRQERLVEELAVMRQLSETALATYQELCVRVGQNSLIRVRKNIYSVPTSLIGRKVKVRLGVWHLEVYYAGQLVETLPRLTGRQKSHVNYRHLIETLLRKPGGFRHYRYREALFPSLVFRRAWEVLNQWHSPRRADMIYLRILHLAARTMEVDVAVALELLLASDGRWNDTDVAQLVGRQPISPPLITQGEVQLELYDRLLNGGTYVRP